MTLLRELANDLALAHFPSQISRDQISRSKSREGHQREAVPPPGERVSVRPSAPIRNALKEGQNTSGWANTLARTTLMASILDPIVSVAYTTFLFTKSDIKTMVIPISFFAVAAAPILTWSRLPHIVFWIWCMAFQFTLSNQTLSPEEDKANKPDRPIPSGRITLQNAIRLRWLSIPACLLLSACYSLETIYGCAGVIILTMLYDDRQWSTCWWFKNGLNGLGYASFELGATLIAGANRHALDRTAVLAVLASAGVIATTIHAQDFKDEHGDRAVGRRTIPILYPSFSRWSIGLTLLAWSLLFSWVWALDAVTSAVLVSLAALIGVRFYMLRTVPEDQVTYYWYNVWLSMVHILPGYYRLYKSA